MKSPFPEMDPYFEACGLWGDFHGHLIEEIHRALANVAPDRYLVRSGERSYVVVVNEEGKENLTFVPDVKLTSPHQPEGPGGAIGVEDVATEAEPLEMEAFVTEDYCERFVEILDAEEDQRLVTCIEVLSPSNKRKGTEGWELYLRKRQGLLLGGASLVLQQHFALMACHKSL